MICACDHEVMIGSNRVLMVNFNMHFFIDAQCVLNIQVQILFPELTLKGLLLAVG